MVKKPTNSKFSDNKVAKRKTPVIERCHLWTDKKTYYNIEKQKSSSCIAYFSSRMIKFSQENKISLLTFCIRLYRLLSYNTASVYSSAKKKMDRNA